jgi:hypothetical protein
MVVASALIGLAGAPAQADPTPVSILVTADAYSADGSNQITNSHEFLYDPAKGDDPANAYQIAYRGNLDMTKVWSSYSLFKLMWMVRNGFSQDRWNAKTFSGDWDISFTVDTAVVNANPSFMNCQAVQTEMDRQNAGTSFGEIMRCDSVAYDESTGKYVAHFVLKHADGSSVTGKDLDQEKYQPKSLSLTSPPQALYVKQSHFKAGKTFAMVEPTVTGKMTMDYFYVGMPLTFSHAGDPVNLKMTNTYNSTFTFKSSTAGRTLPQDVLNLAPQKKTMIQNGETITAPDPAEVRVEAGQGAWVFDGWTPTSATVSGADIEFVGTWSYHVNPDAKFAVTYNYVSESGDSLPQGVLDLLPHPSVAQQGATVTPAAPAETSYKSTAVDGKKTTVTTWTFIGWDPENAVVDGSDLDFRGTWKKHTVVTTQDNNTHGSTTENNTSKDGTGKKTHSGGSAAAGEHTGHSGATSTSATHRGSGHLSSNETPASGKKQLAVTGSAPAAGTVTGGALALLAGVGVLMLARTRKTQR